MKTNISVFLIFAARKYYFLAYDDFYFVCQDNDGSF